MKQNNSGITAVSSIIAEVTLLLSCWGGREAEPLSPSKLLLQHRKRHTRLGLGSNKTTNKVSSSPAIIPFCSALGASPKAGSVVLPAQGARPWISYKPVWRLGTEVCVPQTEYQDNPTQQVKKRKRREFKEISRVEMHKAKT